MINDWVDNQEKILAEQTDPTKTNSVRENNERLWEEFEMAFHDTWTDMAKKQNAYDQLMRLTINGWDINTYIATFECLALAASWDLCSEGMIAKFCEGLCSG